jgi:hypothetical protein
MLNLKSNLVDLIVGISVVLLAYYAGPSFLPVDFILMAFYPIWLLFIKPLSTETAAMIQSLIAVFLGMSAATIMSANINSIVIVLLAFLVGYAASRHTLVQSNDKDFTLTTLVCGLVFSVEIETARSVSDGNLGNGNNRYAVFRGDGSSDDGVGVNH